MIWVSGRVHMHPSKARYGQSRWCLEILQTSKIRITGNGLGKISLEMKSTIPRFRGSPKSGRMVK